MTKKILFFLLFLSALPITLLQAQTYYHTENGKIWSYTLNGNEATITGATNTDGTTASGELKFPSQIGAAKVTTIGGTAFYANALITSLIFPESVTTIKGSAFQRSNKITKLSAPKVVTIGSHAFQGCLSLSALSLPEVVTIGRNAFEQCVRISMLSIPKIKTIDENAFMRCANLTTLSLPKTLTSISYNAFNTCTKLETVTFENGTALTEMNSMVFLGCWNLKYIDMTGVTAFPADFTLGRSTTSTSPFSYLLPYTMIYVPAGSYTMDTGQENFVIGNNCDKFVIYDTNNNYKSGRGCEYPILHDFTATTADYKRTLSPAFMSTFRTICLPYNITLPTGLRAYKLVAPTRGATYFRFVSIGDGDGTFQLEANTPYLLRITDYGTHTFDTEHNVLVKATPATMEVALADGKTFFGGTTTNIDNATAASNNYYNLANDTWYPIRTTDTNGYVHSFRAYIRTTGGTPAKGFAMVIDDDENATTDIDNAAELTEDELRSGKYTFYTLDGRRAGTNYDTLKSGEMYVVKGQKFYKF